MTREHAQDYRRRLRRILFDEGIEAVLNMVPEGVIKKRSICEDYRKYGSGRTVMLHNVSQPYISKICGCSNQETE